jgi:hypothetical protein
MINLYYFLVKVNQARFEACLFHIKQLLHFNSTQALSIADITITDLLFSPYAY